MRQGPDVALQLHAAGVRLIFLVGFMGAGKTEIARRLGGELGWQAVDLDRQIEAAAGSSIGDIFAGKGEGSFRRLESDALRAVFEMEPSHPMVVALGGGAFAEAGNRKLITASGQPSVFLNASPGQLWSRCRAAGSIRPLAQDENQFRQLYERRLPAYMEAEIVVETDGKSIAQVMHEVLAALTHRQKRKGSRQ